MACCRRRTRPISWAGSVRRFVRRWQRVGNSKDPKESTQNGGTGRRTSLREMPQRCGNAFQRPDRSQQRQQLNRHCPHRSAALATVLANRLRLRGMPTRLVGAVDRLHQRTTLRRSVCDARGATSIGGVGTCWHFTGVPLAARLFAHDVNPARFSSVKRFATSADRSTGRPGFLQTKRELRWQTSSMSVTVRKRSGGPVMTVVKIENGRLCKFSKPTLASRWFTPTAVESLWFSEGDLEVVKLKIATPEHPTVTQSIREH